MPHKGFPPALKALAAQAAGLGTAVVLARTGIVALPPLGLATLQAAMAVLYAVLLRSDRWWLPLHLLFGPAVVLAAGRAIPGWVYLLVFGLLLLVYGSSFRTQVPLFLSNRRTVAAVAAWLPRDRPLQLLDVGSGTGSFALQLARLRPDCAVEGVEQAPLPALIARLTARGQANARLVRGDFWRRSLAGHDVVYAFLSPVPMAALWDKAAAEMRPGSWLVSNSFAVPGRNADAVLAVDDRRGTQLLCYRIPDRTGADACT